MNSINENQPEHNFENLNNQEAIAKIKELVGQSDVCFFCTDAETGPSMGVRPMSIQQVADNGDLWLVSANDSHTNQEIAMKPAVKLYFKGSEHSGFMYLAGTAVILQDKQKIKELWKPVMKTWFTEGEDDPRISLIKVSPTTGYYWDNKSGNFVAGIKMLVGAAIGKTLDDSIEGQLNV
ncbi:pyridoxamine 5'-phosphate oxidase family protein [Taibaiella chishuiensis]|uniref:General stress protein 26 n=1 Tax=Taibaiella chishuiensis TaxID=1434707 RepID=A0A2P8CZG7_9BACT|nr:pyridoxamine 5'-phosphate oxidase family protein [Taibaiella chishuiensis]PSK90363.1 general stress protein 26 [Taibaiella chishuiensis]